MGLETNVDKVADLNDAWPLGTDPKSQGDDHIRYCKKAMLSGDFSGIDLVADNVSDSNGNLRAAFTNPNLIINGDMSVWQRGTSFTAAGYTADRWERGDTGDTSRGTDLYSCAITRASAGDANFGQKIESASTHSLVGQQVTFTYEVKGSTINPPTTVELLSANATDDFTNRTSIQAISISSTVGVHSVTFNALPASAANGVMVRLNMTFSAGTNTQRISNVKLERGSVATPFIPDDPATNLAKCQRYYQSYVQVNLLTDRDDITKRSAYRDLVPKRSVGTITYDSLTNMTINQIGIQGYANNTLYITGTSTVNINNFSGVIGLAIDAEL